MLIYSGKLLVRAPREGEGLAFLERGLLGKITSRPLFPAFELTIENLDRPGDRWSLVESDDPDLAANPWDTAHRVAEASRYSAYVEPDLLNTLTAPVSYSSVPSGGCDPDWPPSQPVSPGWHLLSDRTGFDDVRTKALGTGCRIAHLDTGYWPPHMSRPRHVRRDLGWNFYEDNKDTTDHGTGFNSGHGTATMALLAAGKLDLSYGGKVFNHHFGGAPDAEVVPVRISPSVIHISTSMMAQGIDYALAPRDDSKNKCDIITISMGGLPSLSWATAVNQAYDAGIVIVAAAGNNIHYGISDLPFHETVWPSRYSRVVTAVGATYDKTPYRTTKFGKMHGSYGPPSVLDKTVAAYTPNVAWMLYNTVDEYSMDGGGTSSATPQIAAACALWLQVYGANFPAGWRRVEACRKALFSSARAAPSQFQEYLGRGYLRVPELLDAAHNSQSNFADLRKLEEDDNRCPLWRWFLGRELSGIKDRMLEVEAAQVIQRSTNRILIQARFNIEKDPKWLSERRAMVLTALRAEPDMSAALKRQIAELN